MNHTEAAIGSDTLPSNWFHAPYSTFDSAIESSVLPSAACHPQADCQLPEVATDSACDSAPRSGKLLGGMEFMWMRAHFDQNVAMIIDPPVGNTLVPFDYNYELSPRVWLGWQSLRGGGFRATYFRFDEQADSEAVTAVTGSTPVFVYVYGAGGNLSRNAQAQVGETLTSNHRLKLQALDLEATQRFGWNSLQGTLAGGVRIASIQQYMRGDVRDAGGVLQEAVSNDLNVEGAGPTISLQLRRGLGTSRLGVYGGLRGSLLMSETTQKIYEMKNVFTTELEDAAVHREVITALEMSMGLQWNQARGDHSHWFARGGYEGQAWFDAGGPVDSSSTISLDAITFALGMQF
ncbi:Lpg1974 family pore-forming outer membrane protein [Novipirellula galeiformis]|uniref:Lpg1974 family pore-forming outer membrane protein n=1 Tax=Novipirellula galeiformis TaxID=2528004 RepID=UPI001E3147C0|nr:Lpg1974 family pore-forming outer membrane protein [Novipirellula galeiformis]